MICSWRWYISDAGERDRCELLVEVVNVSFIGGGLGCC